MSALPQSSLARAVLVRNIPASADEAAVDEFFSFCGAIESKALTPVPPAAPAATATLEAIVVFTDEGSRRTALLMTGSSLLDEPVDILPVPDGYSLAATAAAPAPAPGGLGGLFASVGLGDMFASMGGVLSGEMERAGALLGAAGESDVVRSAREGAAAAAARTGALVSRIDEEYHVGERAGAVAGAVGEKTRGVLGEIDGKLHVAEVVKGLRERALENEAVSSGISGFKSGLDSLLSQTGLLGTRAVGEGVAGGPRVEAAAELPPAAAAAAAPAATS
jgi:hypothetical protein